MIPSTKTTLQRKNVGKIHYRLCSIRPFQEFDGFKLYRQEHRTSIRERYGINKATEIAKKASDLWRSMSTKEKSVYCKRAATAKMKKNVLKEALLKEKVLSRELKKTKTVIKNARK